MEINLPDSIRSDIVGNCVINGVFWAQPQAEQLSMRPRQVKQP